MPNSPDRPVSPSDGENPEPRYKSADYRVRIPINELLKYYPHPDPERLKRKLDFFFRAQMVHRVVRPIMVGDQEGISRHMGRLRKHALGHAYWYDEFREE